LLARSTALAILFAGSLAGGVCAADNAFAADFSLPKASECVVQISGRISPGDFKRFRSFAEAELPPAHPESSFNKTVCLNSPGGDLGEAALFARYIFEQGIGTVVDEGQRCFSACAIMFMMGTAIGAELGYINRRLHVRGSLGFHRPVLDVSSSAPSDSDRLLSRAYDAAMARAMDLLIVANNRAPWGNVQMMKPDLVQAMLQHQGDDFFLIDTVDKAGRWEIEVFGFDYPSLTTEEQAYYACENSLQWSIGTTEDDITYATVNRLPPKPTASADMAKATAIRSSDGSTAFEVTGREAGYASVGCYVSQPKGYTNPVGCGVNEYTRVTVGAAACTADNYEEMMLALNALAIFNPKLKLAEIPDYLATTAEPRKAEVSIPAAPSVTHPRCYVLRGTSVLDEKRCTMEESAKKLLGRDANVTSFQWPEGTRTVVVRYVDDGSVELNGVSTTPYSRDGYDSCYHNSNTGNDFCYARSLH
jgi:hypothetical protein